MVVEVVVNVAATACEKSGWLAKGRSVGCARRDGRRNRALGKKPNLNELAGPL